MVEDISTPGTYGIGRRTTALSAVFTDVAICVNSGLKIPKQHALVVTTKLK